MLMEKKLIIMLSAILSVIVFNACSATTTKLNSFQNKTNPTEIIVSIKEKPKCDFTELAIIKTGNNWNLDLALNEAKEAAANTGATHFTADKIIVQDQSNYTSVIGTAYFCK